MSATAEQAGGAIGIALFYAIFHTVYITIVNPLMNDKGLPSLSSEQHQALYDTLIAAESTGLRPSEVPSDLQAYLLVTRTASGIGYATVFLAMTVLAVVGLVVTARMVRKPPTEAADAET